MATGATTILLESFSTCSRDDHNAGITNHYEPAAASEPEPLNADPVGECADLFHHALGGVSSTSSSAMVSEPVAAPLDDGNNVYPMSTFGAVLYAVDSLPWRLSG